MRTRLPLIVALSCLGAAQAVAQERPAERQRVLERLRGLPPAEAVVQDTAPPDSLRADSLAADSAAADTLPPVAPGELVRLPHDSLEARLLALPGYVPVRYSGDGAQFATETDRLYLTGAGKVSREGQSLATDSVLVYDGQSGVVCGYGTPVLEGLDNAPVESDSLCFDTETRVGMASGARTTFDQGATWYVRGERNRVFTVGSDRLYGERTDFTSCDLPEPHYHFSAARVKMIKDQVMVARDVTLKFEDVPVFWLPFMVQSMKRGRRSGLLFPEFGMNDIVRNSTGYQRRISNLGLYWAVNDYMGAQVTLDWWAENFLGVEGRLDYSWNRQFLNGNLMLKRFWRESGRREFTATANTRWRPTERTSLNVDAQFSSSSDFVVENSFDPEELNRDIRSNANVRHRFDWGNLSLGAQRRQYLSQDRVDLTLPNVALSLQPISISETLGLTWSGNANVTSRSTTFDARPLPGQRDTRGLRAQMGSNLDLGQFRWDQSLDFRRDITAVGVQEDSATTMVLPERQRDVVDWRTSVGYTIPLIPGTTLTPSLRASGQAVDDSLTSGYVSAPMRLNTSASLSTTVYGFWPGLGPVTRIRHKISPSLTWTYSPAPTATPLQDSVFGPANLRETNQISLNFNQTFEAKLEGGPADTVDMSLPAAGEPPPPGEPRRLPQARKVQLLAINTSAIGYDFVKKQEEGFGFTIDQFRTGLRSGLLDGFNVSLTHDLFEEHRVTTGEDTRTERDFKPHLSNVNASFSLDSDFWLFRALGLSGTGGTPAPDTAAADTTGAPGGERSSQGGMMERPGTSRGGPAAGGGGPGGRAGVGGWSASLVYSLVRPRPDADGRSTRQENQQLRGDISYRPSEFWTVRWSTSYSFTQGEFSDHVLTLSRDLHRWRANFDFRRTQTGNFAFVFRVSLIDNPDLKVDYRQQNTQARPRGF